LFLVPVDDDLVYRTVETLTALGPLQIEAYCRNEVESLWEVQNFNENKKLFFNTQMMCRGWPIPDHEVFYRENLNKEFNPDIIGISAMFEYHYDTVIALSKICQEIYPNAFQVLGGNLSQYKDIIQKTNIKAICFGEGEKPFLGLLKSKNRDDYLKSSPSWYTGDDSKQLKQNRLTNEELSHIPTLNLKLRKNYNNSMPISFSYGCNGSCVFCTVHNTRKGGITHKELSVIKEEILYYYKSFGINSFCAIDDCPFEDQEYFIELLKFFKENNLKAHIFNVPFFNITEEIVKLISETFVYPQVALSADASCERVYKEIVKKKGDWNHLKQVIKWFQKYNIKAMVQMLIGYPGETKEEIENIPNVCKDLDADLYSICIVQPMTGSRLLKICQDNNYIVGQLDSSFINIKTCIINDGLKDPKWVAEMANKLEYIVNLKS
jgi:radical SAM superfamily enzyme YgiQ (UPF0313 family)